MKKNLFRIGFVLIFFVFQGLALNAQSDKDIIKAANDDFKNKSYELAFQKIITVAEPEKKKVQEVLKSCYPNLIADYLSKATAIKLSDKDSLKVKCEKLGQVIGFLNDALLADSLYKKFASPDLYKSTSKKKKIESTMKTSANKLKTYNAAIAQKEIENKAKDSIAKDSALNTPPIEQVSGTTSGPDQSMSGIATETSVKTGSNGPTEAISSEGKKYYIIAGSYKTEEDAQAAVSTLKASGYNSSEVVGQNAYGSFRISYSSFASKEEATTELEKIRLVQADAWILEK